MNMGRRSLRDWTGTKRYEQIKRAAERRDLHGTFVNCNQQQWTLNALHFLDGYLPKMACILVVSSDSPRLQIS